MIDIVIIICAASITNIMHIITVLQHTMCQHIIMMHIKKSDSCQRAHYVLWA